MAIHARTWPTCQAVTRALNLVGLGKVPTLTMRHKVGAENGKGATALDGLLLLRTSSACRTMALSGSASKIAIDECADTEGVGFVWDGRIFDDISCLHLVSEG